MPLHSPKGWVAGAQWGWDEAYLRLIYPGLAALGKQVCMCAAELTITVMTLWPRPHCPLVSNRLTSGCCSRLREWTREWKIFFFTVSSLYTFTFPIKIKEIFGEKKSRSNANFLDKPAVTHPSPPTPPACRPSYLLSVNDPEKLTTVCIHPPALLQRCSYLLNYLESALS